MARAGVYRLQASDDRFDRALTGTSVLQARLARAGPARAMAAMRESHVVHVRDQYRPHVAVASEYLKTVRTVTLGAGQGAAFPLPSQGQYLGDIAFHVVFPALDAGLHPGVAKFRYTRLLGGRLLARARLRWGGQTVSEYTRDDVIFADKRVPASLRPAWDEAMGEEVRKVAIYHNDDDYDQFLDYADGPQTHKGLHGELHLWVPAQFWFCQDPGRALPNSQKAASQRHVELELAGLAELVKAYDASRAEVALPFATLTVRIEMYTRLLFVPAAIQRALARSSRVSLIRTPRRQLARLEKAEGRVLLDQFKFPCEHMMVGVRDPANLDDFDHWPLFGRERVRSAETELDQTVVETSSGDKEIITKAFNEYSCLDPLLQTLGVSSLQVPLYDKSRVGLYSAYLPLRGRLPCSGDDSAWLVPFCLRPGEWQPSGYLNLSSTRELYLDYTGSGITRAAPAELVVVASTLNFLIVSGDRVELLYNL